jgi:hypothetical protein
VGDGIGASIILAQPVSTIASVLDVTSMAKGNLDSFAIDCNSKANIGIISDYTLGIGPSLNNYYSDILIQNYLVTGWRAYDNNDCYFERVVIVNSPNNPNNINSVNPTAALRSIASGGPLQFLNCNFLNDVYVAAQTISFTDCVTVGITIEGSGYNTLNYIGGYAFPSNGNKKSTVFISPNNNVSVNNPSEGGPITFVGTHIEIGQYQYLVNSQLQSGSTSVSGKFHYGVNATGCHIFSPGGPGGGGLISPVLSSTYFPFATSKFSNCWFTSITIPLSMQSTTTPTGTFILQYENCYSNSYYFNSPNYLNLATGGDVKGQLGLPGVGAINGVANNFFKDGGQDCASYTANNVILRGHWGMGLQDNNGTTSGFIDFRLGKIDLKTGFYVNNKPAMTLDGAGFPNINGLQQYTNNATAKAAFGVGRLYHINGAVMVTI